MFEPVSLCLYCCHSKGYDGTSLSDLTKAMGVNRPNLYGAFSDKEALFRKALDRYVNGPAAYTQKALKEPTVRAVVERLLRGAADLNTAPRNPGGCLMVQGALACSQSAESIWQELTASRAAGVADAVCQKVFRWLTLGGSFVFSVEHPIFTANCGTAMVSRSTK
jgi:AcrR family transcriptional regulator